MSLRMPGTGSKTVPRVIVAEDGMASNTSDEEKLVVNFISCWTREWPAATNLEREFIIAQCIVLVNVNLDGKDILSLAEVERDLALIPFG